MIHVDKEDYKIIDDILKKYPYSFYVYGSRSTGKQQKFSDLDLCVIDETITQSQIFDLKDEFEESDLPFTVDVTLWSEMSKDFQKLIRQDFQLWPK